MRRAILHIKSGQPITDASGTPTSAILSNQTEVQIIDTATGEVLAGLEGVQAINIAMPMDGFVTATIVSDVVGLDVYAEADVPE